MRVGVIGSRGVAAWDFGQLGLAAGDVVVTGGARGVDQAAESWARSQGLEVEVHLPDYARYGRAAPHVRNRQIVESCDLVVAIWDGQSRGTASVIERCRKSGRQVKVFAAG